jgi:hypothetical protein
MLRSSRKLKRPSRSNAVRATLPEGVYAFGSVLRCDVVQDAIHLPQPAAVRVHDARSNTDGIPADVDARPLRSLPARVPGLHVVTPLVWSAWPRPYKNRLQVHEQADAASPENGCAIDAAGTGDAKGGRWRAASGRRAAIRQHRPAAGCASRTPSCAKTRSTRKGRYRCARSSCIEMGFLLWFASVSASTGRSGTGQAKLPPPTARPDERTPARSIEGRVYSRLPATIFGPRRDRR